MDYILQNSKEIMMLCFGGGFVILALVASRCLWIATKTLRKVNAITDLTVEYINKPLSMIVQAEKTVNRFLNKMNR